jgi:hypothetical protein
MRTDTHTLAMRITKLLIESELTLNQQFEVLQIVKKRIEICKEVAKDIKRTDQLNLQL